MSEPKMTQDEPIAVLIVPQDDRFNSIVGYFLKIATDLSLSTHADSEGDMVKAVAW